ncbi:MAG: class I fructose-bisphosphate aldolase, partial [Candidatus Lokiarchaeota archaeon]|nr:class I fructose-bisphosphate aldolase [Candidatus Lokiarchaeota archaeon]MBD3342767.1 class I fructose-bisphosphate aldolase [Candidatus Lokiarchaeota archaeon]
VFEQTDRNNLVLNNMERLFNQRGRLAGTGYLSVLPVDQGIEHTASASFAKNPAYFDPENIIKLALDGGCNAIASTLGILGNMSRKYSRKIPFIVKINHNELLTKPEISDQTMFANVDQAWKMGAAAVGATIYFGSLESRRQIQEVSEAFNYAHELGLVCVLWCYLRNKEEFVKDGKDYHTSNDMESQANHLGVTIEADIIKQKISTLNRGFLELNFGRTDKLVYDKLATEHPLEWNRYQIANCYMGRIGLINSGGESGGNDLVDAVKSAVINKRSGGMGLILGRKAFKKSTPEGIKILNAVQDIYLNENITIA